MTSDYDVFEILGKGTFGEVVKSWKRSSGEMVAIKILKNDSYRSRIIKNELKLLQTMAEVDMEESHIVQFHEFFHDELKFYLVFELLEQNLFDFQKEHNFSPLPIRHIRTVTTQVLRALAKLKELSIIHADLKPENIMLVDQVRYPFYVKVIDFGSASIFNEVRYVKEPYIQSRFYRAPEILLGLPFCEKVDVWSLGCVMAELHLGWPLYPGNNEYDQIRYICETQGMPRHTILNAARKVHLFFKRGQHQEAVNTWQLKTPAEYLADTKVKPAERRKYILKSLDQLGTLNVHKMIYPDAEAMAEHLDLRSMVELIKRMLTWDSHERITPSAALKHPYVSTQPLKQNYSHTQYYQWCLRSLLESLPSGSKVGGEAEGLQPYGALEEERFYATQESFPEEEEENNATHSVQRTTSQMDGLSLAEAGRDPPPVAWDDGDSRGLYEPFSGPAEAASGRRKTLQQTFRLRQEQEPILAFYRNRHSSPKHRKASRRAPPDLAFDNLILLGQASPEDVADWEKGSNHSATSLAEPGAREGPGLPPGRMLSPTVQAGSEDKGSPSERARRGCGAPAPLGSGGTGFAPEGATYGSFGSLALLFSAHKLARARLRQPCEEGAKTRVARPDPSQVLWSVLPASAAPALRKKMKPRVTYQQLKILHPPEDLPPAGRATQDFHCILVTAILGTMLVAALLVHTFLFPFHSSPRAENVTAASYLDDTCSDPCRIVLVESIPEGLVYEDNSTVGPPTFDAWAKLLADARSTVDIAAFYWTLQNKDTRTRDPSASQGEEILAELLKLSERGITTRIAVNPPSSRLPSTDLLALEESGAQIRKVDLPRLTSGILHTKFWIVDQTHVYLGSANMDWRALTQVKELGVAVYNCSCLARDLGKLFEAYWALGLPNATIPSPWPTNFSTSYNKETPLPLQLNGTQAGVYLSSSPPALCAPGRTRDLEAVLSVIDGAREFVYVAVMSYLPTMEFSHPRRFWPVIDDHLRKVAYERRVRVRLLVGCWKHSKATMFPFLRSLAAMHDNRTRYSIEVRLFVVPANETQAQIPYARVNHNKYMVSDQVAYIGTSNWSGDYFVHTAGSALVVNQSQVESGDQPTVRDQLEAVFERDWNSQYSRELNLLGQLGDLCGGH
ncbi:UNVERIFIED_CONTAM: hypothetical protein K2H54_037851 [Gekko kuhli]